jgi:hypothetical protein
MLQKVCHIQTVEHEHKLTCEPQITHFVNTFPRVHFLCPLTTCAVYRSTNGSMPREVG